MSVDPNTGWWR